MLLVIQILLKTILTTNQNISCLVTEATFKHTGCISNEVYS